MTPYRKMTQRKKAGGVVQVAPLPEFKPQHHQTNKKTCLVFICKPDPGEFLSTGIRGGYGKVRVEEQHPGPCAAMRSRTRSGPRSRAPVSQVPGDGGGPAQPHKRRSSRPALLGSHAITRPLRSPRPPEKAEADDLIQPPGGPSGGWDSCGPSGHVAQERAARHAGLCARGGGGARRVGGAWRGPRERERCRSRGADSRVPCRCWCGRTGRLVRFPDAGLGASPDVENVTVHL
jgi:hypothetical protein